MLFKLSFWNGPICAIYCTGARPCGAPGDSRFAFFALNKQNKIASGEFFTNLVLNTNYLICESQFGKCVHPILFCGRRSPTQNTILPFIGLGKNYLLKYLINSWHLLHVSRIEVPLADTQNEKTDRKYLRILEISQHAVIPIFPPGAWT